MSFIQKWSLIQDKTVLSCTLETGVTCNYKPSICHIFVTACCAAIVILGIKEFGINIFALYKRIPLI